LDESALYEKNRNFAQMTSKLNRWMMGILAVVCITAQTLVALPHHHHGDAVMPCFNITHCAEHENGHAAEDATCHHDHRTPESEPAADHHCNVRVDVAEAPTFQPHNRCPVCELAAVNDFFASEVLVPAELFTSLHSFTLTRWRQQPAAVDRCALFFAEVHSARAPSILV
jgi:hypothetical protein